MFLFVAVVDEGYTSVKRFFHQLFLALRIVKEVNTLSAKIKSFGKREGERSQKQKRSRIGGWIYFNASCLGSGYMCSLLSRPLQTTDDDGCAAGLCKRPHETAWKNGTVESGSETRKKWVSITKCNWPNKEHLLGDNDVRLLIRSRSNAAQLYGQWNLHNLLVERSPSKEFKYLFLFILFFFFAELSFQIGTSELFSLSSRRSINEAKGGSVKSD